jgi:type IV pilus assembly protein PilP
MKRHTTTWLVGAALLIASATAVAEQGDGATPAPARGSAPGADAAYDPAGRRDPFRPPRANQTTAAGEIKSPLQRYDLGQLKLVAVIYQANEPRAVVEDDAGLGYIVKVGTSIGANGGAVKAIEQGKVRVQEESVDFYGDRQTSEVVMELATEERGK